MEKTELLSESYDLSEDELANKLSEDVSKASEKKDKALSIHLFGIKYAKTIRDRNYSIKNIISKAKLEDSWGGELNKGIKLSDYVGLKIKSEDEKRYCVISANPTKYDHTKCFNDNGCVDWVQKQCFSNVKVGDIVFVYVTQPVSQIKYKCVIEKKDINSKNTIDSNVYYKDPNDYKKEEKYVRLKPVFRQSTRKIPKSHC